MRKKIMVVIKVMDEDRIISEDRESYDNLVVVRK